MIRKRLQHGRIWTAAPVDCIGQSHSRGIGQTFDQRSSRGDGTAIQKGRNITEGRMVSVPTVNDGLGGDPSHALAGRGVRHVANSVKDLTQAQITSPVPYCQPATKCRVSER